MFQNKVCLRYIIVALLFLFPLTTIAQITRVSGTITDFKTRQTIPYVSIKSSDSTVLTTSQADGKFFIQSNKPINQILVSYVGYKTKILNIKPGSDQILNIRLEAISQQLGEIVIRAKKNPRYRNKENPAVELIREVIAHKEQNKPEQYDNVQFKEYDKMMFSFLNVSPTLADKKFFRKYKFLIDNRDSTTIPGKTLLPIYLDENLSQNYYRRSPEKNKTIVLGHKSVNYGDYFDNEGLGQYFKHMYYKVDIYENNIFLMTNMFLSPICNSAPTFYKFFITDTVMVGHTKVVELSFTPRNTTDMLFEGKIYITLDGNYAVQKASLTVNKNINLNFVKSLHVDQEFEQNPDKRYHLSKSSTIVDFSFNKSGSGGLLGIRTITYGDYQVNKTAPDSVYNGPSKVELGEAASRPDEYWSQNRLDTLTKAESKVYHNIDTLKTIPSYRRTMEIVTLLLAGYKSFGPFEMGPANAFYSFNPVEGFKLRLGGRTTPELSNRYYFETYAAYGFKDERWKYFLSATYSLNNKSIYRFPQNYLRVSYQKDTQIPGLNLQFVEEDNFLLSFKRGNNDKYLYNDFLKFDYVHEFENHFSYSIGFRKWTQAPAGSLYFSNQINGLSNTIPNLTSTQITAELRYAPNEQFYQGKIYRVDIPNKYPIFTLDYARGFKDFLGGEYNFQNLHLSIAKRFYLSQLGYGDFLGEGIQVFGQIPWPLLSIPRANQTYAYDIYSYNLMNFLEFVNDHSASATLDYHFNGFFFNKIPLFKKLKWRETFSFKSLWGGLRDENNPAIHPSLYQFPIDGSGQPISYIMGKTPYIEGSVGIENIFKFVRVDLVRRFTYLNDPEVAKWGIRTHVLFTF